MLSAMFVQPERNLGKEVAKMEIPEGGRLPAIIGRGAWEALKTDPQKEKSLKIQVRTLDDVIDKLHVLPIPGPRQVFTPLVNDMWVRQIPRDSASWPLG